MDDAARLLDHLGRPGAIRLGAAHTGTRPAALPTGLAPLDALLGGGVPRGCITEIAGPRSTGRTGLACSIAATVTRTGALAAWIDPDDALDPETMAATGLLLAHMLWVHPRNPDDALRAADLLLAAGGFALVVLDLPSPEIARGFTRWTRLSRAAERSGTALLVLSAARRVGAIAALGLEATARRAEWRGGAGHPCLLDGVTTRLTVARARYVRPGDQLVLRRACG